MTMAHYTCIEWGRVLHILIHCAIRSKIGTLCALYDLISGETLDINGRDNDGQTPFMVAVILGQIEAVRLLHKHGRF